MAVGDQNDIISRLRSYLPRAWFGVWGSAPIIGGLISGIASTLAITYTLVMFMWAQTRLQTSTGAWIDLWAADFLGTSLPRSPGEGDAAYIARIRIAIFSAKGTRAAVASVLTALTGRAPSIFEPMRPADTGCYGGPTIGYSVAGGYGSMLLPFQAFITAYRQPLALQTDSAAGYGISTAGYGVASRAEYGSMNVFQGLVSDAAIYAAINSVRPVCATLWVRIQTSPPTPINYLDQTFVLNTSALI